MEEKLIVGIDIGGTNFRIGAVDGQNRVLNFSRRPVDSVLKGGEPLHELADFISGYISALPGETLAVSIGFPAPLDKARKTVMQAPNIPGLENLPVVDGLSQLLGLPVCIERDVNMLLSYDMQAHTVSADGLCCAFYFGTGIGNAIFINGKPFVGKNGVAGELGHIPVDGSNEECGCGLRGCIENLAGGKYLVRLREEKYPDTPIEQLFVRHGEEEPLLRFVDRMAQAVSTEIGILDPDYVLIGGGVPAMQGFPTEYLRQRIHARLRKPYPAQGLCIMFAEEAEEKGVIGAAIYCRSNMNK